MPSLARVIVGTWIIVAIGIACAQEKVPVRNGTPRSDGREIIMMRHAYVDEGSYDYWYQQSAAGVWPWFERLGARILGDFEVVYPIGGDRTPDQDEALRFARYASYEHWQATRSGQNAGATGGSLSLAGSGGLSNASSIGISNRRGVQQGSRGGLFLQGYMAPTRPLYMPGTAERFETVSAETPGSVIAVSSAAARPGEPILGLEYRRIQKGSFEQYHLITRDQLYPYLEKIGVRPVGQWRVLYLPNSGAEENSDYDEIYTLTHYASFEHYMAIQSNPAALGGDGPDYQLMISGLRTLKGMSLQNNTEFLRGPLFGSPPVYAPPEPGNYRLAP
ncbi:MAG: hypothetical protein CMD92_00285 [Gammaproteobacteria bacterium]|nr:hypothetical protein [Gammaproteobacteria bacterium]